MSSLHLSLPALALVAAATAACQRSGSSSSATSEPASSASSAAPTPSSQAASSAPAASASAPAAAGSQAAAAPDDPLAVVSRALSARGVDPACTTMTSSKSAGQTEVEVREKHGGKCPGDPVTAPTVGRYRVSAKGALTVYDVVEDAWEPVVKTAPAPAPASAAGIKGKIVLERKATDGAGNHRYVLTLDKHGKSAHLYAYDFCDAAPSPGAACWMIQDGIDDCEDDLAVDFQGEKLFLQPSGKDTAAAVLYRTSCTSDMSGLTMKLIGYDHGKKFAVRGTTGLKGSIKPERKTSMEAGPLRTWALATWDKHAIQQ